MDKIASPQELTQELRRLLAYCEGCEPSRQVLARELEGLANKVAGFSKKANWWHVVLVRDQGNTYEVAIVGEDPNTPGWYSLDYMMKEVKGRIKKEANKVDSLLKKQEGFTVQGMSFPKFGNSRKNLYIGWEIYGQKDPAVDLESLLKEHGFRVKPY
jgi:hypothetical protein